MPADAPTAARPPEQPAARLPHLPGLDGLRALAVIAVLFYHAGPYLPGGFLGVESFFVLSGFLITALLLAEWQQRGRIDLTAFWLRRARRLLPALFLVLAGTLALAAVLLPGELPMVRADALAALGYVMNWHLVLSQQPYFDPLVRPPLLQHLWSLAVEEQFYLLWPLLFSIGMRYGRAAGLLIATLAAAGASSALMLLLYQPGGDPSRIYYGTDTRAAGILLGAALALVWTPWRTPATTRRGLGVLLDSAGVLGLGGLIAGTIWVSEQHALLYRGGFALIAIATLMVIAAATHPRARVVPGLLSWQPLRWIGLRSYGLYLWHWPVFQLTRPYLDVPFDGWALLVLRLAIVVALAALSYRYIELPIRHGALVRAWRALWTRRRAAPAHHSSHPMRWRWLHLPIASALLISSAACAARAGAQPLATRALVAAPTTSQPATSSAAAAPPPMALPIATAISSVAMPGTPIAQATPTATARPTATVPLPTSTPVPAPTAAALQPFDPTLAAELQRILDQTVADGYIPGAVLAVSIPGQQPWTGASGVADRSQGHPMQPTTGIRIASISKMFTAVVALQLVEEGKLDLDAPVATWLPDLLPNGDAITIRNLLQHTSGLYDYLEDRNFVTQAYQTPARVWEPRELVAYATRFPPTFEPGVEGAWDYASTNYVILGMIIEQVTGRMLADEMRQRIFDPLGLEHTFFPPQEPIRIDLAHGYSNRVDQTQAPMTFVFATANIVSTASDVRRFAQALFEGQLLEPATFALMTSFVNGQGQYRMPNWNMAWGLCATNCRSAPILVGSPARQRQARCLVISAGTAGSARQSGSLPRAGSRSPWGSTRPPPTQTSWPRASSMPS